MVKQAKVVANKLANLFKAIVFMIVCVFIVMGLAVALINIYKTKHWNVLHNKL